MQGVNGADDYPNGTVYQKSLLNDEEMISYLEGYVGNAKNSSNGGYQNGQMFNSQALEFLEDRIKMHDTSTQAKNITRGIKYNSSKQTDHRYLGEEILKSKCISERSNDSVSSWLASSSAPGTPVQKKNPVLKGRCLTILGRAYEEGLLGLAKNREMAVYLYHHAAIDHCADGTYHLARCFEHGLGVEVDYDRACYFYRLSYKLGHAKGMHRYALMLLRGNDFVNRDVLSGYYLLKMAVSKANRSYPEPYYDLGMLYTIKNEYTIADEKYAFRIFLKGAKLGCTKCQYRVSEDYEDGMHVEKDIDKAFYWCKLAAENGGTDAQYKVACVLSGHKGRRRMAEGVETTIMDVDLARYYTRDIDLTQEAYRMASSAASAGNVNAILYVADAQERGKGVEKNLLLSLWYYKIAIVLGAKEAIWKMKALETAILTNKKEKGIFEKAVRKIKGL